MTSAPSPLGQAPTWRTLLVTTFVAAVVAAAVVVLFVLPAEFGIDPTGVGRVLGLTAIAESEAVTIDAAQATAPTAAGNLVQLGPATLAQKMPMADVRTLAIDPYQFVEYKYHLEKGATMVFSWSAPSPVIYDMHGEGDGLMPADGSAPPEPTSYAKGTNAAQHGAFTAPFTGIHGWYWENPGATPITVTIRSTGLYARAIELRSPRIRRTHVLTTIDALPVPDQPAQGR